MDSPDHFWLVFHPDGRLYFSTTATEVTTYGAYNQGGPVLKVKRPSIEQLEALSTGKPLVLVPLEPTDEALQRAHDGPLGAGDHVMDETNKGWLTDMYRAFLGSTA